MEPLVDKVDPAEVVDDVNAFGQLSVTAQELKEFKLSCFSDTPLSIETCNPPEGSGVEFCSLYRPCAIFLGARLGVGRAPDEPYVFAVSKRRCAKMPHAELVEKIREKQLAAEPEFVEAAMLPAVKPASKPVPRSAKKKAPAPEAQTVPAVAAEKPVEKPVEAAEKPEKAPKKKAVAKAPVAKKKPAKAPKKPTPSKADAAPPKKAKKAKKKPAKKRVIKTIKATKAKPKPVKKPKAKKVAKKKTTVEKLSGKGRGRPRIHPFDASVHLPEVKPSYWRTAGVIKESHPKHPITVDEAHARLLSIGYRARPNSRAGVLLELAKRSGGASLEEMVEAWTKKKFKTPFLKHMLKCFVKAGAFSKHGDTYVLGGH